MVQFLCSQRLAPVKASFSNCSLTTAVDTTFVCVCVHVYNEVQAVYL